MEHVERIRVAFADTDASGRIHFTAALRYFEVAGHALERRLLGGKLAQEIDIAGFPRVDVGAQLLAPLAAGDELDVTARVEKIGRTSLTFSFDGVRADGTLCLTGRIVAVAIDAAGRSTPLTSKLKAGFETALTPPK